MHSFFRLYAFKSEFVCEEIGTHSREDGENIHCRLRIVLAFSFLSFVSEKIFHCAEKQEE